MNRLFSFLTKNEAHGFIRLAAKVFKVIHIVMGIAAAIYFIIMGINSGFFATFFIMFIAGLVALCVSMFMGIFIEAMLIGFANIVENQFEELILKNKADEVKESFYLNKKQKAGFEKLEKFNELRKSGAITDEEYEAKKKEYLDNI